MRLNNLSVKWKTAIPIIAAVAVGIVITVFVTGSKTKEIVLSEIKDSSLKGYREGVLNSLTALMTREKYKESEKSFLEEMRQVADIRVIRAEILDRDFGKGRAEDYPADDFEREVIQTGIEQVRVEDSFIRGVYPYVAKTGSGAAKDCLSCHKVREGEVLGAISVRIPLTDSFGRIRSLQYLYAALGLAGIIAVMGIAIMVVSITLKPVKALESAAGKVASGDISFDADIRSEDELGRLSKMLKDSSRSLGSIFMRIRGLSERIAKVAEDVEREAEKVVRGAEVETEAIVNISHSVEELSATATEITENTEGLAVSAEETSASMEEMASSIGTVNMSIQELSSAVEETSSSIEQLSATIRDVAGNAEELASASDETLSAVSEITVSVKEVEQNAKEAARLSERVTSDAATFGITSVEKTIEGMRKIKTSVERTNDLIRKLGGRSDEIGKILTVIDDVTDQTTLLALNAAILAAQAGEHGKGFSVVAEEIKDLAERAAISTQEIASLIQSVQLEVKNAVAAMREGLTSVEDGFRLANAAGDTLQKVLESAKQSSEMSRSIERSTAEQAKAANLVAAAMERVRNGANQIANATAEQSRGAALIIKATEKMKEVSGQVSKATEEQTITSKQISSAMDLVAERSEQMSRSLAEHKIGSQNILCTVEGVKEVPVENRKMAFNIGNTLRDLQKDSELLKVEMQRFKFYEEKHAGAVVKFGVLPVEPPAVMFRKFSPLADYLGRKIGKTVELKVAIDFENALADLGHKVTHVCTLGPITYIEANKMYGLKVIAKGLRDGKPHHRAAIVTLAASDLKSIRDLKGRSFAFGDVKSASGHVAPQLMLKDAGIDLDDLKYHHFFGHYDEVARAVVKGDFDAGAVTESVGQHYRDQGLRILAYSDEIPEWNICSNNSLDEGDISLLKSALLSLNSSTAESSAVLKAIDEHYTGFVEAENRDYDGIRTKMERLGMI
ncbi:MAG: phosphate/phosphite/phosphonate ABC transporter substrate-binding protein [Thermodesulfovibrionales bacterium]